MPAFIFVFGLWAFIYYCKNDLISPRKYRAMKHELKVRMEELEKARLERDKRHVKPLPDKGWEYEEAMESRRLQDPNYAQIAELRKLNGYNRKIKFDIRGRFSESVKDFFRDNTQLYAHATLYHEEDNRHDSHAVRIKMGRRRPGYVPKHLSEQVKKIIEHDHYMAYISKIDWYDGHVSVSMVLEYKS